MVEIDTLYQTKNNTFYRGTYLYSLYKGLPPPPPGAKNALQIMSLAAYASETNEEKNKGANSTVAKRKH